MVKMKSLKNLDNRPFKNQQECTKEIVSRAWYLMIWISIISQELDILKSNTRVLQNNNLHNLEVKNKR